MRRGIRQGMTRTLRVLLCIAVFGAAVPVAAASEWQLDDTTLEMLMERVEENKARLGLTPEQEKRVMPILEAGRDRQLAILESYGIGRGQKPSLRLRQKLKLAREMKAARADTVSALSRHMSPEQIAVYKDIQDERRERMKAYLKKQKS